MISKDQKQSIKSLLGHRYVEAIRNRLDAKGLLNKKGESYSNTQITNVMNGVTHSVIEPVIWELVAEKQKELENREELLNKKSAVAAAD